MNDNNGRQYRLLWLVALLALVLSFVSYSRTRGEDDIMSINQLNLTGPEDQTIFRLSAPLPNPIVRGEELQRSSKVYGLQFLDDEGNEMGGLGTIPDMKAGILCFDHETAEAMCFTKVQDSLRISLFNKPEEGTTLGEAGATRLSIGLDKSEGTAFIVLADNQGLPRIRMSVGEDGEPRLEFWDADGELIQSLPQ